MRHGSRQWVLRSFQHAAQHDVKLATAHTACVLVHKVMSQARRANEMPGIVIYAIVIYAKHRWAQRKVSLDQKRISQQLCISNTTVHRYKYKQAAT